MSTRIKRALALTLLVVLTLMSHSGISLSEAADHPLKGQKIEMSILGIGGWVPSRLGVYMSPIFAEYAKEQYGYEVNFTFTDAPFSGVFQVAATSLEKESQEYNLIISDSQWLGALAERGWIVNISELIKVHPELAIEWWDPVVIDTYMEYPEGWGELWGLPQEADVLVLFVRKDLFGNPTEREAFKKQHDMDLPQMFEDFEALSMEDFEKIAKFFTRPEQGLYGTAMQYSHEYDFLTMYLYPFIYSMGGEIWEPKEGKIYGVLNSDINAEAMVWNKRMLQYQPPDALNYGISENMEAFAEGKVATALQWAAVGLAMITPENEENVIVVPPPGIKQRDGSLKRIYPMGGQPWVINAFNDDAHMRVAIDFLKWWYLPETQLEFAKGGGNPAVKATLEMPGFDDIQPWFRVMKYMLKQEHARDFWHDPKYAELLAVQQDAFRAYVTKQIDDPALALEYAACQQQKILFESGKSTISPPASCINVSLR
jgi:multiple sugar transport system substrate-binding protein